MLFFRNKKISITYGITVCNEADELKKLLSTLVPLIDAEDEIVVLQDITNKDVLTSKVIADYQDNIKTIEAQLNNDFATFKNQLIGAAAGDYLFQIDADEIPELLLISNIKKILAKKSRYDCFLVPRINLVHGLTPAHIEKWNWKLDSKNRINFPDFQLRIFKLNGFIKWKHKVHEELFGFKRCYYLPAESESFCLLHIKTIEKQSKQNQYYDSIQK